MQQPLCTSTRTQVGRRVSNAAAQERQNHDQILPNLHRHGLTNLALNEGFEDNHLVEGQAHSTQFQEPIQQNTSNTISMADEVQTEHEKKHRGPTHMMEIWGRPSSLPRIQLDFDRFGRPIGPNQSKFCEFLGTVARNGMYCPLDVEDWHKMPGEYKKKMLHIVKSRYDIALGDEGWILSSINKKWRKWKSNLKTRYFVEDKNVDDLLNERDGRVLEDQWVNMLAYWNKEEVKARSEKNINARSKRSMNHLTGKRSFAQIYDKLAKENGRPPSRAELLDACYTSNGNTPSIVSKYLVCLVIDIDALLKW